MQVGIIGLGNMGARMAKKLTENGYAVSGFDISSDRVNSLKGENSIQDFLEIQKEQTIKYFIISLPSEESIFKTLESWKFLPGTVLIDMSTVNVKFSFSNFEKMKKKNVGYIDAPVLGMPAQVGSWTIPVGGKVKDYEASLPILKVLGKNVEYMGNSGSGSLIKILNNMISLSAWATISEAVLLADKNGLDLMKMYNIIKSSGSGAVSPMLDRIKRIAENDYKNICSVDVNIKDLEAAYNLALDLKIPTIMTSAALNMHLLAHERGFGDLDMNAIVLSFESFKKRHEVS